MNIPESELILTASHASGPGGQNVNKRNTRVTLHWNISQSQVLSEEQKKRCLDKLKNRINAEGLLVIHVDLLRSQHLNRELAHERLNALVEQALKIRKKRIPTEVSRRSDQARLKHKKKAGLQKKARLISLDAYDSET